MANIRVTGSYEIAVDSNRDYEAREYIKEYVAKDGKTVSQYRSIGHYGDVEHALTGIYKDSCIQHAESKGNISIQEWIEIVDNCTKEFKEILASHKLD